MGESCKFDGVQVLFVSLAWHFLEVQTTQHDTTEVERDRLQREALKRDGKIKPQVPQSCCPAGNGVLRLQVALLGTSERNEDLEQVSVVQFDSVVSHYGL